MFVISWQTKIVLIGLSAMQTGMQPLRKPRIFNTAFESGIRSLVILTNFFPVSLTLRQIVIFDYLVVHTSDIDGPDSLHPNENFRGAELLVRRQLVESGLALMQVRQLITRNASREGFKYAAGNEAGNFVDLLTSFYNRSLKERASWLSLNFGAISESALDDLVRRRLDTWTPEFQLGNGT